MVDGRLTEGFRGGSGFGNVSAELQAALEFGLAGFFGRVGAKGAVIGLSGGIDSAVSAVLLTSVLGADRVLAVNMPSRFSSQTTQDAARELAANLGVEYVVHPIESVVAAKRADYEELTGRAMKPLTFENIQARERGNVLMTWAQERGFLVVGNGNKTEFQRGYATLYGDLIGAIMPLGDVPKTQVYRLAHRFNRLRPGVIPQAIIDIPPSAELSEAQDVNRGLGDPFDYDVEAPMGVELVEYAMTPGELRRLFEGRKLNPEVWAPVRGNRDVYDKMSADAFEALAWEVFRAIEATVFKRVQSPPILKVSRKAFGCDLRESMFVRLHV
jgi:NAD+ synthase (glutamine-hydrolysing)